MGDRSVRIGGSVIGGAVVTGDHNVTNVRYRKVTLPPAEGVALSRPNWRRCVICWAA
jgi:hypothetical protein